MTVYRQFDRIKARKEVAQMEESTLNWEAVKVELNRRFIVIDEEKK